ncbi:MAG: family 16 glycosylhydrolase [Pseudomonadota bacterium]
MGGYFRLGWAISIVPVVAMATACAAPQFEAIEGPPDLGDEWYLTFESEFEKPAFAGGNRSFVLEGYDRVEPSSDNAKWEIREGPNKEAYAVDENVLITGRVEGADSALILRTSIDEAWTGNFSNPMRTGYIRTRNYRNSDPREELRFAQRFGYFEARMILDTAPGQWGAFWLMPERSTWCADSSGRDGTEIDIVEGYPRKPASNKNRNKSVNFAIHYDGYRAFHKKKIQPFPTGRQRRSFTHFDTSNFHTYGLLWTPEKYVWYIDGQPVYQIDDPDQISQVEKFIKLSTEVAAWSGELDSRTLPADTIVDWVRVWQTDRLAEGNPYIFEAEAPSVDRGAGVWTQRLTAGTWCRGTFAKSNKTGRLTVPIDEPVDTKEIGIRVSNPHDDESDLKLFVNGELAKSWTNIDLDQIFVLKHNLGGDRAEEIEIEWTGGIAVDQVYLVPNESLYP